MAGVGWVWESEVGGEARAMLRGCLHRLRGKRRGCNFGYFCMLQCHPVSLLQGKALLSRWEGSQTLAAGNGMYAPRCTVGLIRSILSQSESTAERREEPREFYKMSLDFHRGQRFTEQISGQRSWTLIKQLLWPHHHRQKQIAANSLTAFICQVAPSTLETLIHLILYVTP